MKENANLNKKIWLKEIINQKNIQIILKAIIYSAEVGISAVDENGLHIIVNPAYTRLTGFTEEDIIGKSPILNVHRGYISLLLEVLRTMKPIYDAKVKIGPKNKEVIVNVSPIIIDGVLKGSVAVIQDVSEIKYLSKELDRFKKRVRHLESKYTFEDIVGNSVGIIKAKEQAKRVANTPATVLLQGESGTGKELFAHAIHHASKRKNQQFIRVNCSAFTDTLLGSELFGYEEGSFTGAKKTGKKGLFEEADKGTIFLDEVGIMSFNLQVNLLRVLQEKEIVRVGGIHPINVDVRVISATNIDLKNAVNEGRFRKDLYYRLFVVPIYIPPLRERKKDLPILIKNLIRKYNQDFGRNVRGISPEAIDLLMNYSWPGNVRELENIIGRSIINMEPIEKIILPKHILYFEDKGKNKKILTTTNEYTNTKEYYLDEASLEKARNNAEKLVIINALKSINGDNLKVAKKLGISLRNFYYKIKKYDIKELRN